MSIKRFSPSGTRKQTKYICKNLPFQGYITPQASGHKAHLRTGAAARKPRPNAPKILSPKAFFHKKEPLYQDSGKQERKVEEDRLFLLRVANRTVEEEELVLYTRLFQMAWILASKMQDALKLREVIANGLRAVGAYLSPDAVEFDDEFFNDLSQAVEVCRGIIEQSGQLERAQALDAVTNRNSHIGLESITGKNINDAEVHL